MAAEALVEAFQADLLAISPSQVYEKYVAVESCAGMGDSPLLGLRNQIAERFQIEASSVVIVGSAKLGFTLKSHSRPRYSAFSYDSDVDVAIVSDIAFDQVWKASLDYWHRSGYAKSAGLWRNGDKFRNYIFRGWMRPDMLPSSGAYKYRDEWFDFFQQLTSDRAAGDFKITAGLYREEHFLRTYQTILIEQCAQELRIAT